MFYRKCFCSKQDLRAPSADRCKILMHDRNLLGLEAAIMQVQNLEAPQKGAKNMQNLA